MKIFTWKYWRYRLCGFRGHKQLCHLIYEPDHSHTLKRCWCGINVKVITKKHKPNQIKGQHADLVILDESKEMK